MNAVNKSKEKQCQYINENVKINKGKHLKRKQ